MSLLNTETANTTPSFELDEEMAALIAATSSGPAVAAAQAPATEAAAPVKAVSQPASAQAPVPLSGHALALAGARGVFAAYNNALPVDFNTLDQLIATNGNFVDRETKTVLGDKVTFTLLSYQDSFVVSPEDDAAPKEAVRFSNDGVTCSDGTDVKEHLVFLKENGYPGARLKARVVVVGALKSASKTDKFNGKLVQFDLSPASRTLWLRFAANTTYGLSAGRITREQMENVSAEALLKSRGNDTYTVAEFKVE